MKVIAKDIVTQPAVTQTIDELDYPFITIDNPKNKTLRIRVTPTVTVVVADAEYDALGSNWGDSDLLDYIKTKFDLVEETEE